LLAEVWVVACPVRAPCLGVTLPASPECASPLCWGLVCGGRFAACSWSPCGRGGCRWRGLCACSSMFEGVGGCAGRRLGRLGCLLVDDFCGAGVGLLSVRGCGLRWWPLTWSSRVTVRRGLRVGEAAPRWGEAAFEAVGRWRDTERCVIVTQHVVGWGGKHPNTRENTKEHEEIGRAHV